MGVFKVENLPRFKNFSSFSIFAAQYWYNTVDIEKEKIS